MVNVMTAEMVDKIHRDMITASQPKPDVPVYILSSWSKSVVYLVAPEDYHLTDRTWMEYCIEFSIHSRSVG